MRMKIKIIMISIMTILSINAFSLDEELKEKELMLSSCQIDYQSGTALENYEQQLLCYKNARLNEEKSKLQSSMTRLSDIGNEDLENMLSFLKKFIIYALTFVAAIAGLKRVLNVSNIFSDPVDMIFKGILSTAIISAIMSGSIYGILKGVTIYYQDVNFATSSFFISIQAQAHSSKDNAIKSEINTVNQKAILLTNSIIQSEICANNFMQNHLTSNYDFKFKGDLSDNTLDCIDEQKAVAPKITDSGRSPLNYAVKVCSSKHKARDVDCGKINVEMSSKDVKSSIEIASIGIFQTIQGFDGKLCQEQLSLKGHEKPEGYCREWTGESFKLKSNEISGSVEEVLIGQVLLFTNDLKNAIVSSIKNEELVNEIQMFNYFQHLYSLIASEMGRTEVIFQAREELEKISSQKPSARNLYNGYRSAFDKENESFEINSISDYSATINKRVAVILTSDEVTSKYMNELFEIIKNPLLLIGEMKKDGYEINPYGFKKITTHSEELAWIAFGMQFTSAAMTQVGGSFSYAAQPIRFAANTLILLVFVIVIYIIYRCLEFFKYNFISLPGKVVNLLLTLSMITIVKPHTDKILTIIFDIIFSSKRTMLFILSFSLMAFVVGFGYDVISSYRTMGMIKNNDSVNYISNVILIILVLLFYIVIHDRIHKTIVKDDMKLSNTSQMNSMKGSDNDNIKQISNKIKSLR